MSYSREFIEWFIDVLPPGYEWLGRPIVAIGIALIFIAAITAPSIVLRGIRSRSDDPDELRH